MQLDSKHCIGCAPRRSLTAHKDWKEVIETLRAKFHTVKLPKSFLAVNLSESHTFHKKDEVDREETAATHTEGVASHEGIGPLDHPPELGQPEADAEVVHNNLLSPEPEKQQQHDENSTVPPTPDSRSS